MQTAIMGRMDMSELCARHKGLAAGAGMSMLQAQSLGIGDGHQAAAAFDKRQIKGAKLEGLMRLDRGILIKLFMWRAARGSGPQAVASGKGEHGLAFCRSGQMRAL